MRSELRHVGLAQRDQPGGAEARAERVIGIRPVVELAKNAVALVLRQSGLVGAEILEQERNSRQRSGRPPLSYRRGSGFASAVEVAEHERVEGGVERLDP